MTAFDRIAKAASEHGWTTITPDNSWERYRYERRNGRKIESVSVVFDVRGRVNTANWSPDRSGISALTIHPTDRDKTAEVIEWLSRR